MLALTRKFGEAVWIGEEIRIQVVTARHGAAKLAITAPKDMIIEREEIRTDRIRAGRPLTPYRANAVRIAANNTAKKASE